MTSKSAKSRVAVLSLALISALPIAGPGCSSDTDSAKSPTAALSPALATVGPGTVLGIPADPGETASQMQSSSPAAQAVIAKTSPLLGLKPIEAACLAVRLDADPALRDALGDLPTRSARYADLGTLAQTCIRTTTGAINFANSIGDGNPNLTPQNLTCLRDGYAALSAEQVNTIIQGGLDPTRATDEAARTLNGLFERCQIDRTTLNAAPR